jgi:hypothetical protein
MSYLGKQPATQGKDAGPAVKIDDIASNFNGSVTVFDLAVESTAVNPHPNNLAVYLNGVLQHPGDSYAVSGSQIKFNEAPDTGLSFHGHILGSVRTNTPDEQTVTPSTLHDTTKTLISGSFNKGAVSASFAQKGAVSASFAQSSAVTASLRSHVLTSALSGSTTLISGSVASTGSFGSIYTDKNVNASAFVGDGSSLTGIDIPTAAAISGSVVSGVSGSVASTGSFGRVEAAGDVELKAGNLIIGTHGKGIDFSANTDDASGMTAEILDDYEEGTWDAVVTDGTNPMTMQGAYDTGYYTKVGNLVTVTGYFYTLDLGDPAASGGIYMTGLPFTVANNNGAYSGGVAGHAGGLTITAGYTVTYAASKNNTTISLNLWDATDGSSTILASEWGANGRIILCFSYRAA